jgi:hypothetical protein
MKTLLNLSLVTALLLASCNPIWAQDQSRPVYTNAGAPVNGTNEVDTITIQSSTTALIFTLTVTGGRTTAPITWSATDATLIANIDAAVEALSAVGVGGVTTAAGTGTSGVGTYTLTFTGKNAAQNFPALTLTEVSRTGGTAATISTTTAGVAGTFVNAKTGDLLEDTTNGDLYQNISTTALAPNWQFVRPMGFKTGAGGAVTQATSRTTGVTLSTRAGKITTTADSMAAQAPTTFTVTNTLVAATDVVVISKLSGDVDTFAWVNSTAAGSFTVTLFNSHASAADTTAFAFNFVVIKAAID